jgi:hypothetical protein
MVPPSGKDANNNQLFANPPHVRDFGDLVGSQELPAAQRSEPSKRAARLARRRRSSVAAAILAMLLERGENGATDDELLDELAGRRGPDKPAVTANTVRPARCKLRDQGFVRDSGRIRASETGAPATVWIISG